MSKKRVFSLHCPCGAEYHSHLSRKSSTPAGRSLRERLRKEWRMKHKGHRRPSKQ